MKYFVVSDIHSYAKHLFEALENAGYDKNNSNHTLIVCGDVFDRGENTMAIYNFLTSIPKDNLKLIQGNHELLYLELLEKSFPDKHDFSNGTVKTFCQIADIDIEKLSSSYYFRIGESTQWKNKILKTWEEIKEKVANSEVTKWIKSDQWINYFEIENFIFVHSFIPVKINDNLPYYYIENRNFEYNSNWRENATEDEWNAAKWGCPYLNFKKGLFDQEIQKGKILICGHWSSSDFHKYFDKFHFTKHTPYFGKNIIAIDACTFDSCMTNVLVIDENFNVFDGNKIKSLN